ncbi:AfsR/SARP family transcriptional regulator [Streptomyces sp. MI02-7b]|uniref:AfsR/SARP family transcriptional regulator n=1 Tax=Streptomyces sp. MI02-7b TaxID=462941 RepID=UPI0029B7A503|nr:BTAD domain-containing putative transcriptional regulator [Streptomyces sp. MI02-7b]MDX3075963.1 BTAD domain-containing putative transcriptional regulator [Streptomyces sp. MI02-7b]
MVVRFQILGPVRAWRDGAEVKLGPPKRRALFALLLAQSGQPVPLHAILDALWGPEPPTTAVNVVHRHVGALRRLLEPDLPSGTASRRLVRDAGGYRVEVEPDELDLLRFRALRTRAQQVALHGDRARATGFLVEALGMWRGPTASGIAPEVRAHPVFAAVDNEHLIAVKEAAGYAPAAGAVLTERVLVTLRQAAAHHPLDEVLQARLIEVLAATGHQAEALEVYQGVRARIADELGLDPGPELREAQHKVLDGTAVVRPAPQDPVPVLDGVPADAAGPAADAPGGAELLRPAQLPRDLAAFSGRRAELELSRMLPSGPAEPAQAVVISGMAGVGKTTLAVHWAHRIADRFPDGQLYLDLRGFHLTGAAMGTAEALRALLDAFGTPVGRIPAGLEAQAAFYRSLLAGRRVLVVLDNARDSEQVRPLLPSAPGCLAVVTSRHQLQGLVAAEGARSFTLDLLGDGDAVELLALRLGAERVAREPTAAAEIVALCGRLPLALAIVSARAALNPGFPLSAIAEELRESHGSLDAFTGEVPLGDARCVFSWSYHALSPEAARLFRLLAVHPGPDWSVAAAASLSARRPGQTRALLAELVRAHLLFENVPGRFSCHGLLRAYATELAGEHDAPAEAVAACARLLDHYLHSAHAADAALAPHRERIALRRPAPHTLPERFTDRRAAAEWLDAERSVLLAVIEHDGRHGDGAHSWRLAVLVELYLDRGGRWQEQRTAQTTATTAAQRQGDVLGQAHAHRALGFALGRLERWESAREHLLRALQLFGEVGEPCGQARVHRYWAFLSNRHGWHADALRHYALAGDLYRSGGHLNGEASVHNEVGWTYMLLGEYDKAVEECRCSLVIHQETGDRNGEAAAWDSLGCAYHRLHRHEEALDCFRRALRMYREIRDAYLEADTLVHISDTHLAASAATAAADALRQALSILDGMGHPDAEGVRRKLRDIELNPVVPRVRV